MNNNNNKKPNQTGTTIGFDNFLYNEYGGIYDWDVWHKTFKRFQTYRVLSNVINKNQIELLIQPDENPSVYNEFIDYNLGDYNSNDYKDFKTYINSIDSMFASQYNSSIPHPTILDIHSEFDRQLQEQEESSIKNDSLSAKPLLDRVNDALYVIESSQFFIKQDLSITIDTPKDKKGDSGNKNRLKATQHQLQNKLQGGDGNPQQPENPMNNGNSALTESIIKSYLVSSKNINFKELMWKPYMINVYVPYNYKDKTKTNSFNDTGKTNAFFKFQVSPDNILYVYPTDNIENATTISFAVPLSIKLINKMFFEQFIDEVAFKQLLIAIDSYQNTYTPQLIISLQTSTDIFKSKRGYKVGRKQGNFSKEVDFFSLSSGNQGFSGFEDLNRVFVNMELQIPKTISDIDIALDVLSETNLPISLKENREKNIEALKEINYKSTFRAKSTKENVTPKVVYENMQYHIYMGEPLVIAEYDIASSMLFTNDINRDSQIFLDTLPVFKYSLNTINKDYNDLNFRIADAFDVFIAKANNQAKRDLTNERSEALSIVALSKGNVPQGQASITSINTEGTILRNVNNAGIKDLNNTGRILPVQDYIIFNNYLVSVGEELNNRLDEALGYQVSSPTDMNQQDPNSQVRKGYNTYTPLMKNIATTLLKEVIFNHLIAGRSEFNKTIIHFSGNRAYSGSNELINLFRVVFDESVLIGDELDKVNQQQYNALISSSSNGQDSSKLLSQVQSMLKNKKIANN